MTDSEKLFFELKSDVPPSAQEYHDKKRDDGWGSVRPRSLAFAQTRSEFSQVGFVPSTLPLFRLVLFCAFAHAC